MKKIFSQFTITLFAIFFTLQSFGQTTLEEYNYVTKGYIIQLESGLDMKKGYEFEDANSHSTKERSADLKVLYRVNDGDKIKIAAYLVIYKRAGNPTEYICIPHPESDKEVMDKYWTQLYDGKGDSSQRLQLISYLLTSQMKW